uniref:(northern house mosquito) hypothetical protein n=1 Tax=Culex pipiens TaxID=7175 RepID=A0A8D8FZ55_CULPI
MTTPNVGRFPLSPPAKSPTFPGKGWPNFTIPQSLSHNRALLSPSSTLRKHTKHDSLSNTPANRAPVGPTDDRSHRLTNTNTMRRIQPTHTIFLRLSSRLHTLNLHAS